MRLVARVDLEKGSKCRPIQCVFHAKHSLADENRKTGYRANSTRRIRMLCRTGTLPPSPFMTRNRMAIDLDFRKPDVEIDA